MLAGNWKSYADFVSKTDYMEPEYPDRNELCEEWIEQWENEHEKADEDTGDILEKFFEKIVYPCYDDSGSNYVDWTLEEIKDKLLEWYSKNHHEMETQFGNLIREVQRRDLKDKCEETETLKKSRLLYSNQTGSCI